jgi:hypothetical protein
VHTIETNIPNRVDESIYFPNKNNAMSLIVSNSMNRHYPVGDFSGFNEVDMTMNVDWIKVSQPFCCGVNKTVCSLADLDNQTYFTDILTGQKLTIGNSSNSCIFKQFHPGDNLPGTLTPDYRDIPVILLATDEIAINGDAIFPGDTYAEMRITNCGSVNRMEANDEKQLVEILTLQQQVADSVHNHIQDSLINVYKNNYIDSLASTYNATDVCKIKISPNPVQNFINIDAHQWCYENIVSLHLIDVNGVDFELDKTPQINVDKYVPGNYILKVIMRDGSVIIQKIIKI